MSGCVGRVGWDYLVFSLFVILIYCTQEMARGQVVRDTAVQLADDREVVVLSRMLRAIAAALLVVLLTAGWLIAGYREQLARRDLEEDHKGMATILADGLERLGHSGLGAAVPPDDPSVARFSATISQWMRLNPRIVSVYTIRQLSDGSKAFVLAPGTDGEPGYPGEGAALERAFRGEVLFTEDDEFLGRSTVSLVVPLRDPGGRVEAVAGIVFEAAAWHGALTLERAVVMGGVFILVLVLNSLHWLVYRIKLDPILQRRFSAELMESEARFRNFADHAPVLLQVTDAAGKHLFFNQTWLDFIGQSPGAGCSQDWLEFVHPEDRGELEARRTAAFARRTSFRHEFRLRRTCGEYRWMTAEFIPRWQDVDFAGYVGSCTDITAHKQLEQVLHRQADTAKLIAAISAEFVNIGPGDIDAAIRVTLEEIGRFMGADRAHIFLFSEDLAAAYLAYGWQAAGVRPMQEVRPVIDGEIASWLVAKLKTSGWLYYPRFGEVSARWQSEYLRQAKLKSLVVVPLTLGDMSFGFLSLHAVNGERLWQEEEILLPKLVGEVIVSALQRCQTEAALEMSEAHNKAIVNSVPDVMYHVGSDGVILDLKPSKEDGGSAVSALIGRSIGHMLPAHLVKPALDAVAQALASGEVQLFEYYQQEDNRTTYYEARVTRAGVEDVLMTVRDITERRRSEACDLLLLDIAVRVLEEQPLEEILSFACQQISIIFGIRILWVGRKEDDGAVRLFAVGDEAAECIAGMSTRWDETSFGLGPTGSAIRTGKFQLFEIEDPRLLPWRDRLDKYGAVSCVSFPLKVGGLILGALTLFASDRSIWTKRTIVHLTNFAEQIALAIYSTTNRQRLKLLTAGLESAANAVAITDRAGNIQWVNPAFLDLTGLTPTVAMGENIRATIAGSHSRMFYRVVWQHVLAGKPWQGEVTSRRRDGKYYAAEMTITPVRDDSGEIVNCIIIIQDVTVRRQAERETLEAREAVARAERLSSLGVMAAGIAHEINQPLNSLKVTADGMLYWHRLGKTPALGKIMENIEKISKQADRIDSIIKHMRSFVRSQCGDPGECDINTAVAESLSLLGAQLAAHGIEVAVDLADDLPLVRANNTQLEEVIINLLVNAMQSLDTVDRPGKRITVTSGHEQGGVYLEISDNGPGISKKIRNKIFEPFFTTKQAGEGMGLGLSIVHSIITSYGGRISVKAPSQREGAVFRIKFPACGDRKRGERQA